MKRTIGRLLGLSLLLALVSAPGCEQPSADCTTGHGAFAAKYTLVEGSKQGSGACDALKGERIGLEKYNPSQTEDPEKQDLTKALLRIRPSTLGDLAIQADEAGVSIEGQELASLGTFDSVMPNEKDICTVPSMSPAGIQIPDGAAIPEADIEYTWKNVRIIVTPAYPGTQMAATLTYREGGCTAEYNVVGLWPAIGCEGTDADGNPNGVADDTLCDPIANPEEGRDLGSGINPDFRANLTCDKDLKLCVLKQTPPALL
jgi:hypothetical protein